jgi:thymidylate kinase
MLTITIEGPIGGGKSTLASAIVRHCEKTGRVALLKEEATDAAIEKIKPDVLIVTKVTR